jgi:hypothetical protein
LDAPTCTIGPAARFEAVPEGGKTDEAVVEKHFVMWKTFLLDRAPSCAYIGCSFLT